MSIVALTGANGFLGWHIRAALLEAGITVQPVPVGDAFDPEYAARTVSGVSRLIHAAGVNRGSDEDVHHGNVHFAEQAAEALTKAAEPPALVVYANSVQADNGTVYGEAKAAAADVLREAAQRTGAGFQDVRLPNLFGEHGRPFYNAVTATFSHMLSQGQRPTVNDDKQLTLLHAQDAADLLAGTIDANVAASLAVDETVEGLLMRLSSMASAYSRGEIPDVAARFDRNLFNTYRSYTFPDRAPIALVRHADSRGSFFEVLRSRGGCGQTSFSTTVPGVTRGDHFHRRKIERFTVLAGEATIRLRKLFSDEVVSFRVTGSEPVAVDMPTMWSHNITNTGDDLLFTSFWTNDIFDPERPDTTSEEVEK
jgi:UDP-2-acetamido-2,6-beta-L-arabino-hexul-4-ose reductase